MKAIIVQWQVYKWLLDKCYLGSLQQFHVLRNTQINYNWRLVNKWRKYCCKERYTLLDAFMFKILNHLKWFEKYELLNHQWFKARINQKSLLHRFYNL